MRSRFRPSIRTHARTHTKTHTRTRTRTPTKTRARIRTDGIRTHVSTHSSTHVWTYIRTHLRTYTEGTCKETLKGTYKDTHKDTHKEHTCWKTAGTWYWYCSSRITVCCTLRTPIFFSITCHRVCSLRESTGTYSDTYMPVRACLCAPRSSFQHSNPLSWPARPSASVGRRSPLPCFLLLDYASHVTTCHKYPCSHQRGQ